MSLRGLLLAAALLAAMTTDAAACHRYSTWHYPWPQSCGVLRPMRPMRPIASHHVGLANIMMGRNPLQAPKPALPLPSLARADLDGGEADEAARARLLLRAALEAANAH
jgi:hypothetical protein